MPYNTRRVSLSLPSLGIQLPGSINIRRTPPQPRPSSAASPNSPAAAANGQSAKRVKRPQSDSSPPPPPRRRKSSLASSRNAVPGARSTVLPRSVDEQTPPPSPIDQSAKVIDKEGINDDIVVAVLEQLEATGNRPHQIKELAALLLNRLSSVASSQNPTAIISTRLANYLRRPWTALAPCPMAKEQVAQHPRRVYYFLTTQPRQAIPEYIEPSMPINMNSHRVLSPNPSSGADDEDMEELVMLNTGAHHLRDSSDSSSGGRHDILLGVGINAHGRDASPSPSVDLGTAYADMDDAHHASMHTHNLSISGSFAGLSFNPSQAPRGFSFMIQNSSNNHESSMSRSQSPPLEHDEKEFTRTASVMQLRKQSEQAERSARESAENSARSTPFEPAMKVEQDADAPAANEAYFGNEMRDAEDNKDEPEDLVDFHQADTHDVEALFGHQAHHLLPFSGMADMSSSPMLRPISNHSSNSSPLATSSGNQGFNKPNLEIRDQKMSGTDDMMPPPKLNCASQSLALEDTEFDLRSPECVDLKELDDLFGGY